MAELFTLDNLFTLCMLILLQAVLGFDNLLYISLESKRAPAEYQQSVRRWGIGLAVGARIVLLFLLLNLIKYTQNVLFSIDWSGVVHAEFNLHSLIVLLGGVFILYTALKEIFHMLNVQDLEHESREPQSVGKVVALIVIMNVVFSFDSILSAMALSDVFFVMATAIIVGGILMIVLADTIATFLQKNRMYEVLGLFILFVVGIMLLSEGGHLAHMTFFDQEITPMTKATFYFVIAVLVVSDIVQSSYQRKILAERALVERRKV